MFKHPYLCKPADEGDTASKMIRKKVLDSDGRVVILSSSAKIFTQRFVMHNKQLEGRLGVILCQM